MNKITLIRHAATDWAEEGRHTGTTDISLNSKGIDQAVELRSLLDEMHFDHILISPLKRAQETAQLANIQGENEPLLVEWNYGKYEGLTSDQIHVNEPGWNIFTHGAPGGESVEDVCRRCDALLDKLESYSGDILIISSGHILRLLATRWAEFPPSAGKGLLLSPASISELGFEKENRVISFWNLT